MFFRIEENACLVDGNALQSENADSLLTCAQMCRREASCKRATFLANKGTCSLFGEGQQAKKLERFVKRDGSFYVKKVFRKFCILCRCHLFFYSVPSQLNETFFESQIFQAMLCGCCCCCFFLFYCFSFSFLFQFMSDFSLKFCNILSNNPTGSSYFDCFSVCYIILISFLADLSSGHISSHLGFFGSS